MEALIQSVLLDPALDHLVLQGLPLSVLLPKEAALLTPSEIRTPSCPFYTHSFSLHEVLCIHYVDILHDDPVLLYYWADVMMPDCLMHCPSSVNSTPWDKIPGWVPTMAYSFLNSDSITTKLSTASTLWGR